MSCFRQRAAFVTAIGLLLSACGGSSSNRPPVIDAIADVTVSANQASTPITFNVTDRGTVQVQAFSDNTALIPDEGIAVSGAGSQFNLIVTPVAAGLGSATITVQAADGRGLRSERQFVVTVDPQPVSFGAFVRDVFADEADQAPRNLNSRVFEADAADDDFADLLN